MRTVVIFDNFGPYHWARLRAAANVCELMAIQIGGRSAVYEWENKIVEGNLKITTLYQQGTSRDVRHGDLERKIDQTLDDFQPRTVFIPGWSSRAAFSALNWCIRNKIPAIAMSESTEWDEKRAAWKEWMKCKLIGLFSAALVGGKPHKDYMVKLGMPAERVFLGYDAVDNRYFADKVAEVRDQKSQIRKKYGLPENYFLASARFIEKKNLPRLLKAYALYREKAEKLKSEALKSESGKPSTINHQPSTPPWDLVLLGDGEMRPALCRLISDLRLQNCVLLPGFIQYPDLPVYYGNAKAFIHASTTEQWGLVVNEAMASGLPVLVSNRCGCAQDLVQEDVNGFTFDPHNAEQIADLMFQVSNFKFQVSDFGSASRKIISNWGTERFAQGLKAAIECAIKVGPKRAAIFDRILLAALIRK